MVAMTSMLPWSTRLINGEVLSGRTRAAMAETRERRRAKMYSLMRLHPDVAEKPEPAVQHAAPSCQWPRFERPRDQLSGLCWHVVHAVNPSDDDLDQALKNVGYENYYPYTLEMRPVAKRHLSAAQRNSAVPLFKRTKVPLFKAYRFVRFDVRDGRWHDLFQLIGIQGVLCVEGAGRPQPAKVMDEYIASLRATEIDGLIPGKITVRDLAYKIGETVRISRGAFEGFNGTVRDIPAKPLDELDGSERLTLLVSLLGREAPVELEIGDIEKL